MPLYHCTECHHEWEKSGKEERSCDWCGAPGRMIQAETAFEAFIKAGSWRGMVRK
jgi:hypothetical protein